MTPVGDRLIVTADDFGLSREVNEAVEIAHRDGILSAASLMVGGPAARDAVARLRRLPDLRVGLHLVLVDGDAVMPGARIPNLVGADGRLRTDMVRLAIAVATRSKVRHQVAEEIEAQFGAFAAIGRPLDHVNAHKHFHLHPVVADLIFAAGRRFGLRAVRVPREPADVLRRAGGRGSSAPIEALMARRLRHQAERAGLVSADAVLGLAWSGAMTAARLAALLRARPPGVIEIYTHPATSDAFPGCAPGYGYRKELAALCDPLCREIVRGAAATGGYADIAAAAPPGGRPVTASLARG